MESVVGLWDLLHTPKKPHSLVLLENHRSFHHALNLLYGTRLRSLGEPVQHYELVTFSGIMVGEFYKTVIGLIKKQQLNTDTLDGFFADIINLVSDTGALSAAEADNLFWSRFDPYTDQFYSGSRDNDFTELNQLLICNCIGYWIPGTETFVTDLSNVLYHHGRQTVDAMARAL